MKKILSLIFISLFCFSTDWSRENSCPTGDEFFVESILNSMTTEEKVGQVVMADISTISPNDLNQYPIGGILNGGNSSPNNNQKASPDEWKKLAQDFYDASVSVGGANVPILWGTDAVHGHSNVFGATIFPHNIGLGATNNPKLLEEIGEVVAKEVLATGIYWTFAPTIAVPQDYRWGRTYEGFSQDPDIVGSLGKAFINGLQGTGDNFLGETKILGTAKHFLGDGGTYMGIDQGDTRIDEESFKNIHGKPYFDALDACIQTVMASYNSWNGLEVHGHEYLLNDVLKDQMNFNGFVVGDWNGHDEVENCTTESCAAALNAGVDMFMAPETWKEIYHNTLAQVNLGEISMDRLDDAVRRILLVKERLGLFSNTQPKNSAFSQVGTADHKAVARKAVRESMVLLKNNNVLPLSNDLKVLVVGYAADSLQIQTGGWTLDWQGTNNTNEDFPGSISLYEAIKETVGSKNVRYVQDVIIDTTTYDEETKPNYSDYDVALVVFGEEPYAEWQGDRGSLVFGQTKQIRQLELLNQAGVPTVSIFFSGRPMWVSKEIELSDAFIVAWLPGTESRGMTDVIFTNESGGINFNFKGKLPYHWPNDPFNEITKDNAKYQLGFGLVY